MTPTTKELAKKLDRLSDPRLHMPDDVRSALRAAAARLRELEEELVQIRPYTNPVIF